MRWTSKVFGGSLGSRVFRSRVTQHLYTDLCLLQVKYKVKVESIYRLKYFLLGLGASDASNCGISPLAY
jgi:hypothetical protein